MANISKAVLDFMEKYKVDSDEVWLAPGGKTWVVMHKALERIASEKGIIFDRPSVIACDMAAKSMVVCTFGKLGETSEWSFGEASPANNKNQYFAAMAEKRSRDRVILKLLVSHGDLYSDSEDDGFTQPRQNPHVTRPEDVYDEISDDIQPSGAPIKKMLVKDSRGVYAALMKEMQRIDDPVELHDWGKAKADEIHSLSGSWPTHFRGEYTNHMKSITSDERLGKPITNGKGT